MEELTKENFWNEMEQKYPIAMEKFKVWIDKYKLDNDWNNLFGKHDLYTEEEYPYRTTFSQTPKFHELPTAMQYGIFYEFVCRFTMEIKEDEGVVFIDNTKETINDYLGLVNGIEGSLNLVNG